VHHIQFLLANKLNRYKGKINSQINSHIKEIQDVYQSTHQEPIIVNKGKQKEDKIQDEEVFLYKLYNISLKSSKLKTLEPTFIQDEVNNLEKYMELL